MRKTLVNSGRILVIIICIFLFYVFFLRDSYIYYSSDFYKAVDSNNISLTSELIKNGADVDEYKPLCTALEKSYPDLSKLLIKSGANIQIECEQAYPPLYYSVLMNDKELLLLLLEKGANIEEITKGPKYKRGNLLHVAADNFSTDVVDILVEKEVDINSQKSFEDKTPLYRAIQDRDTTASMVEVLLKNGADPNLGYGYSSHPSMLAVAYNNLSIAELLLKHGANVNEYEIENYNFNRDSITPILKASLRCFPDMAKLLIKHGADLKAKSKKKGKTVLHLVCEDSRLAQTGYEEVTSEYVHKSEVQLVDLFVANGASVNEKDYKGYTPLHDASSFVTPLLIKHKALVNIKGPYGETPLHNAVLGGNIWKAEELLEAGANVNAKLDESTVVKHITKNTRNGKQTYYTGDEISTPLSLAKTDDMKQLLRKYGAL